MLLSETAKANNRRSFSQVFMQRGIKWKNDPWNNKEPLKAAACRAGGFSLSSGWRKPMNKKRPSLSERTALTAAVMSVLILPVIYFFETRSGGIELPGVYDLMLRFLLIVTLYYSLRNAA